LKEPKGAPIMYRREYNRFEINALAILITNKNVENTFLLKNISARGASVIGNFPLEVSNKLEIVIEIPFLCDEPIRKEAKIVWCKKISDKLWEGGLDFGLDNKISFINW
jgi:hypothetical protein